MTTTISRLVRRIALTGVALATTVSLSTASATAAEQPTAGQVRASNAAAAPHGYAQVCFQAPYMGVYGPFNRTVVIDAYINGVWEPITSTTPGLNGCMTQALPTGWYWRFRVYHYEARTWYIGHSQYTWPVNGRMVNLGTVRLQTFRG